MVLDKEQDVAVHQTGHNSGVVHAGIYYPPGSLKARLCTRGMGLLREYCADRALPYDECGKLVVAVTGDELPRMEALYAKALENRVPGLRRLTAGEIGEIEPHAAGKAALHSPRTAITDYTWIAREFAKDIADSGGEVRLGFEVTGVTRVPNGVEVRSGADTVRVDRLILCAGLQSDAVARLAEDGAEPRIIPFRGEYMTVRPAKTHMVRGLIYPVPDPRYPFLGVHFTRRVSGDVEVGPNAVLAYAREGYRRTRVSPRDLAGIVSWPGTWHMARQHWRTGLKEMYGSLSKSAYMKAARLYVPEIGAADVVRAGCGGAGPGPGPGRHARRRLPYPPGGPGDLRAQRALPCRDLFHGHRGAPRGRGFRRADRSLNTPANRAFSRNKCLRVRVSAEAPVPHSV